MNEAKPTVSTFTDPLHSGIDAAKGAAKEGVDAAIGLVEKTKKRVIDGAHVVDDALHTHPYAAIAVGAGVGLVVGMLLRRCCSR